MNCWSNPADHYNQCQQITLSWPQSPLQSLQSMHTDPTDHCNHGSTLTFCPPDSWSMGRLCACDGLRRPKLETAWAMLRTQIKCFIDCINWDIKGRCSMMKSTWNHAWVCTPFKQPPTFCWLTNRGAWASNLPQKRSDFLLISADHFNSILGLGGSNYPPTAPSHNLRFLANQIVQGTCEPTLAKLLLAGWGKLGSSKPLEGGGVHLCHLSGAFEDFNKNGCTSKASLASC